LRRGGDSAFGEVFEGVIAAIEMRCEPPAGIALFGNFPMCHIRSLLEIAANDSLFRKKGV